MRAQNELAEIKDRAVKFLAAHEEMCRIGQGIGGLAVERPDLMPDFDAWYHASGVDHADTVLAVLEASKSRTITTAEELDALRDGAIILSGEGSYWLNTRLIDGVNCWEEPGRQGISYAADIALPATVLHEGA
jgi:hypothetical protein